MGMCDSSLDSTVERMTQSVLERTLAYQMRVCGLPKPETEYRFHAPRRWRFDFAWPAIMFAIEVEGGTYSKRRKSRHTTPTGFRRDCEKYNQAAIDGWTVLRFDSSQISSGEAITGIASFFKSRGYIK